MHECALVQVLFDRIGDAVRAQRAVAVRRVRVRIGDRAGVEPALFQTAYEVYRVHTVCEAAPLEIEHAVDDDGLLLKELELEVP